MRGHGSWAKLMRTVVPSAYLCWLWRWVLHSECLGMLWPVHGCLAVFACLGVRHTTCQFCTSLARERSRAWPAAAACGHDAHLLWSRSPLADALHPGALAA